MHELNLPERAYRRRRDGRISILLHRSVVLVGKDKIEIRSARSAVWLPAMGLAGVVGAGTWIALTGGTLPFWLMVTLLLFCVVGAPSSVMGLVEATVGADVVADAQKGSITFQQGFLGMGIGTREFVPFERIARFEVTIEGNEPDRWRGETDALRQLAVVLEKDNGKRLVVARLPVPAVQQEEAMDRALATAQALAALTGTSVTIPAGWRLQEVDAATLEPVKKEEREARPKRKKAGGRG